MSELVAIEQDENNGSNSKIKADPAALKIEAVDNEDLADYIRELSSGAAVRIKIERLEPKIWRGKQIAGHIEFVEELLSEEDLKNRHGGGKFKLRIEKKNAAGKWVYATQRQVTIAGDPKVIHLAHGDDLPIVSTNPVVLAEDSSLQKVAMSMMAETAAREREDRIRAQDERNRFADRPKEGMDMGLIQLLLEPLKLQLEAATEQNRALTERLNSLMERKPEPTVQDDIFKKVLLDDNARVNAVREQHNSELRQLKESYKDDVKRAEDRAHDNIKRMEDRHDRDINDREKAHAREMDNIRRSHDSELASIRASYDARLAVIEGESRRSARDLEKREAELTELRGRKEKPLTETIVELAQFNEALGALKSDDKGEPPSTFDKIAAMAGPAFEALAQRMGQPQQQPQMIAIPQQMMQMPVQQQQGQQRIIRKKRQSPPEQATSGAPQQAQASSVLDQIAPSDIKMAVELIESTIQAGTDPVVFAGSIQSLVDGKIIHAIRLAGGVDKFLEGRVQLGINSPLTHAVGKQFLRKLDKALTGDTPTE